MKKIFTVIVLLVTLLLTACGSGLVKTETLEAEVVIIEAHHRDNWLQPMWTGKFFTYIPHPEENEVIVMYEGGQFTVDDEAAYNKYCESIGETAIGVFEVRVYDDGTRRYDLVGLK